VLADSSPADLLAGGWYFATETARILGGHRGILTASQALAQLRPDPAPIGSAR
jgi:energy-coupling factor transport system ATP-binding protein